MNAKRKSPGLPLRKSLQIFCLLHAAMGCLLMADPANLPVSAGTPANITFQVLSEVRVQQGDHFVIYQSVAPPVIPKPALATQPEASAPPQKAKGYLAIGATVYDHHVSELRWTSHGKSLHAFSNIDFNIVAVLSSIQTGTAFYSLFIGYGNESAAELAKANQQAAALGLPAKTLPTAGQFPQNQSAFLMAADSDPTADAEDLAGMTMLHLCYDINKAAIQQAYQARLAAQAVAQQQELKNQSSKPPNTVIRYWPKKSSTYLGAGGTK